jgi:VWFA-related protein
MRRTVAILLTLASFAPLARTQTPQKPSPEPTPDDIIRVTTQLVQTDVVVTDKNDQIVNDLKLEDFELYDQGKKQELKFMEYVGVEGPRRSEGNRPAAAAAAASALPAVVEDAGTPGLTAKDLKRVVAFVIDDLTMQTQDLPSVRKMLLDFVNSKMRNGDLVAIVRVIGGKGLLQQFTSDRQLLRRAIANISLVVHPYGASEVPDPEKMTNPVMSGAVDSPTATMESTNAAPEIFSSNDDQIRYNRSLAAITTANLVIEGLKLIPGRKDLVLITEGIPIFEIHDSGSAYSNTAGILSQLTDNAFRAGVVINSMDPRGLRATPGVKGFASTPAKSAMGGGMTADSAREDANFGKGDAGESSALGGMLAGASDHLGLATVAGLTGGISVVNTNAFEGGLDKILARSNGYYTLAFRPTELDNRNHKLEVKVKRGGSRVYFHKSYLAREDRTTGARTKEEEIAGAALSPLAKADIDVTPNVSVKLQSGRAAVDVQLLIGANKLHFTEGPSGTHRVSFDVVAFIFNELGRRYAGLSETVNLNLTPEDYQIAMTEGVAYSGATELPPGYYQVRAVVRDSSSGNIGTFSKYVEIPDIAKGKFAMSSVFLLAVDNEPKAKLTPLAAQRHLSQKQDLRYVAMIYNPKVKDGKPQLRSQMIISQGNKVLFREPEQAVASNGTVPITKMGQLALAKVQPGRYVLTLVVIDTLADKKVQTVARSIDFNVGR